MKSILIKTGNRQFEMIIDKIKIIKGDDYRTKFLLYQSFLSSVVKESDYQIEYGKKEIYIDGSLFRCKLENIFDVNPFFNIEDDLKMGMKSLSYRYVKSLLSRDEYIDSVNTIDILFQSLGEELNISNDKINVEVCEVTITLLMKFMKLVYLKDEALINAYDFEYEEKILFQLDLIDQILKHSLNESIILMNVDELTENMLKTLQKINCKYIIIFTKKSCFISNNDDMALLANKYYDFSNINDLYLKVCNESGKLWSEEELKLNIIKYFNEINCEEARFIKQQLNKK